MQTHGFALLLWHALQYECFDCGYDAGDDGGDGVGDEGVVTIPHCLDYRGGGGGDRGDDENVLTVPHRL